MANLNDHQIEEYVYLPKGKGGTGGKGKQRSTGKGKDRVGNPRGPDGNPIRCHHCGSTQHFER